MARFWLSFLLIITFGSSAVAQGARVRVSSDVAASHLKSSPAPAYPSLAETARIQGNVILHVAIDSNGNVSPLRVVRGHPMLVPAAMSGVQNWKYSPFSANGQPVSVVTVAVVRFGNPANHDAEDKAEVAFQDKFWETIDRAQAALSTGDLSAAEKALTDGQTALSAGAPPPIHVPERWQWAMSMGELNRQQKRVTAAEQRYTEAIALQKDKKDSWKQPLLSVLWAVCTSNQTNLTYRVTD
jgi:TonB family protein